MGLVAQGAGGGGLSATQTAAILTVDVHPSGDDYALPALNTFTETDGGGTAFDVAELAASQGSAAKYLITKAHEATDHIGRAVVSFTGSELIVALRPLSQTPTGGANYAGVMAILRESSTNKMATVNVSHKATTGFVEIDVAKYSNDTTWVTNGTLPLRVTVGQWVWVRLLPDSGTPTTVVGYAYVGMDRPVSASQWTSLGTLTSCFTTSADQCGFGALSTGIGSGNTLRAEVRAFRIVPGA